MRTILRLLGIIQSPSTPDCSEPPLIMKQWVDCAGAYHTAVFDEEPTERQFGEYSGKKIAAGYSLTRFGAWIDKHRVARKARRILRQKAIIKALDGKEYRGWVHSDNSWKPKERTIKVKR